MRAFVRGLPLALTLILLAPRPCEGLRSGRIPRSDRPRKIEVPSDVARTIQQAIDLVAPEGVVQIKPGVYREHLSIAKLVHIEGSGAVGDKQTAIVDERPVTVPSIRDSVGLFTYLPGGGGSIRDIALIGGDVAVLGVAQDGAAPVPLKIQDSLLDGSARGIAGSFSEMVIVDTSIQHMLWNAASFLCFKLIQMADVFVAENLGVGFRANSCDPSAKVELSDCTFDGNLAGGVVIVGPLNLFGITNSTTNGNGDFGMLLYETGPKVVTDSQAMNNTAGFAQLGHGIVVLGGEPMVVLSSQINANQTAGIALAGCSPADEAVASFVETQVMNNKVGFLLQSLCGLTGCPGGSFAELGGDNVFSNAQHIVTEGCPLPVPQAPPLPQE